MHEQDLAIVKALVPAAWADGEYAEREKEMIDALLDAYSASDAEKKQIREYAATKRTLDDVDVQELSADEVKFIEALAKKLRISDEETKALMASGAERAKKYLKLL